MEWMLMPLKRYAQFSGRSRPKEFWMFFLFILIGIVVLSFVDSMLGLGGSSDSYADAGDGAAAIGFSNSGGILTLLFGLAMLVPNIAVSIRRLHDTDRSGWWVLIGLIPLVGSIILIVFFAQSGTRGPNHFGPDPIEAAPLGAA